MFQFSRREPLTPTLSPRSAGRGRGENPASGRQREKRSSLQKFTGLVERTKHDAGCREGFAGAFFAVHHGEHQRDLSAGIAPRCRRLQRRAPRGVPLLANHHPLAFETPPTCHPPPPPPP